MCYFLDLSGLPPLGFLLYLQAYKPHCFYIGLWLTLGSTDSTTCYWWAYLDTTMIFTPFCIIHPESILAIVLYNILGIIGQASSHGTTSQIFPTCFFPTHAPKKSPGAARHHQLCKPSVYWKVLNSKLAPTYLKTKIWVSVSDGMKQHDTSKEGLSPTTSNSLHSCIRDIQWSQWEKSSKEAKSSLNRGS